MSSNEKDRVTLALGGTLGVDSLEEKERQRERTLIVALDDFFAFMAQAMAQERQRHWAQVNRLQLRVTPSNQPSFVLRPAKVARLEKSNKVVLTWLKAFESRMGEVFQGVIAKLDAAASAYMLKRFGGTPAAPSPKAAKNIAVTHALNRRVLSLPMATHRYRQIAQPVGPQPWQPFVGYGGPTCPALRVASTDASARGMMPPPPPLQTQNYQPAVAVPPPRPLPASVPAKGGDQPVMGVPVDLSHLQQPQPVLGIPADAHVAFHEYLRTVFSRAESAAAEHERLVAREEFMLAYQHAVEINRATIEPTMDPDGNLVAERLDDEDVNAQVGFFHAHAAQQYREVAEQTVNVLRELRVDVESALSTVPSESLTQAAVLQTEPRPALGGKRTREEEEQAVLSEDKKTGAKDEKEYNSGFNPSPSPFKTRGE